MVRPDLKGRQNLSVNPKLVRAHKHLERVEMNVKMADSSEEGDAKSGNLVEEAYEYLVRNIPGGCKRSMASDAYKERPRNLL